MLLRWVQVQDPSATEQPLEIIPAGLGDIRYTPAYAITHTFPKEPEPRTDTELAGFPSAHNLLDILDSTAAPAPMPRHGVTTALSFSEALRARDAAPDAPLPIEAKSGVNLRPTVFLVGVDDRGEVRYCFLQEGSGDETLIDRQAEAALRQHRFSRSETPLEWGFATFIWGAEAHAPRPAQPPPKPQTASPES